jgi:hypothetical protein
MNNGWRDTIETQLEADAAPESQTHRLDARRIGRRWRLAASLLLGLAGAWMIWRALPTTPVDPYALEQKTMVAVYQEAIDDGFGPDWVCRNDEEFAFTFRVAHQQALVLREMPEDVAALGLSYCHTISPRTICILAQAEGRPVMVFVDRLDAEPGRAEAPGGGLHLHRGTVGDLVLYELSPLDTPRVLPLLHDPAGPDGEPTEEDDP